MNSSIKSASYERDRPTEGSNKSQPKRPRRAEKEQLIHCVACKEFSWSKCDVSKTFFQVPCENKHCFCPRCFSSMMASKGSMYYFNCPCGDKKQLDTWTIYYPNNTSRRQMNEKHSLSHPDPNVHPILHHHKQHSQAQHNDKKEAFLSLSTVHEDKKNAKEPSLIAISSKLNVDQIYTMDEEDRTKLHFIFQLLHPILVQGSKNDLGATFEKQNELNVKDLHEIAIQDKSVLFGCLFSLVTGLLPPNGSADRNELKCKETNKNKLLALVFVVTEMIRHAIKGDRGNIKSRGRSILKEYIANQFRVNNAPQSLYRLFNQLEISNSNEACRMDSIQSFQDKLNDGLNFKGKRYDLFLILFDNLGFRTRGAGRVGYEQYTPMQIVNIKKESLIEWGVYPNRNNNDMDENVQGM
jgi:hypothetical protein